MEVLKSFWVHRNLCWGAGLCFWAPLDFSAQQSKGCVHTSAASEATPTINHSRATIPSSPWVPSPRCSWEGQSTSPSTSTLAKKSHAWETLAPATRCQGAKTKCPPTRHGQTDRRREGLQCCRRPSCEVRDEEQQDGQSSWGLHGSSCKWMSGTATASFSRCWVAVDLRLLCCRL